MQTDQQAWLDAAGRVRLLTPEEEILLARQIRAAQGIEPSTTNPQELQRLKRAKRATDRLVSANLRLVYRLVTPYRRLVPDHQFLDLLQAGSEGVLHAAGKFNPESGYKFSTYCAWWIRQRVQIELDWHSRTIRVPTTITPQLRKLPRVRQQLTAQLGRPPNVEELAAALALSPQEVATALERARTPASLDQPLSDGEEDGATLGDLQATPEVWSDQQLLEVRRVLGRLPRLQRRIVEAAYFPGTPTLREVARAEGLTYREAQALLTTALRRLRKLNPGSSSTGGAEQLSLPVPRPRPQELSRQPPRAYRRRSHTPCEGQLVLQLQRRTLRRLTSTL